MKKEQVGLTFLLNDWQRGNDFSTERVFQIVYSELKIIAKSYLNKEKNMVFQTTELVNEAYLRIANSRELSFLNRAHFFGIAARAMRQILVEQFRRNQSQRRFGSAQPQIYNEIMVENLPKSFNYQRLEDALVELASLDPRKNQIVELRFFAGLSIEETAKILEISVSTVKREWLLAKAWLYNHLSG